MARSGEELATSDDGISWGDEPIAGVDDELAFSGDGIA